MIRNILFAIVLFAVAHIAYSQVGTGTDIGVLNQMLAAIQSGVTATGTASGTAVSTKAGVYNLLALDVNTITTGGTAVTVLNAGHASAGCLIENSGSSTLVVNQIGTATGTSTSGNNIAIPAGQEWKCVPSANAVSGISATSSYVFGGYGFQ